MKKTLIAIAAAATLGLATVAAPQPAQARHGRIAAGIGGFALGTFLGAAIANGPYYAYGPGPVYYDPPPCQWTRQRIWDGWGWHWRRVRVCY
jgi:hypothetical protein